MSSSCFGPVFGGESGEATVDEDPVRAAVVQASDVRLLVGAGDDAKLLGVAHVGYGDTFVERLESSGDEVGLEAAAALSAHG